MALLVYSLALTGDQLIRKWTVCVCVWLAGDAALLEAAKKGNLARVQKLVTPQNINCRDTQGRNSTPLHLAGLSNWKSHDHALLYHVVLSLLGPASIPL